MTAEDLRNLLPDRIKAPASELPEWAYCQCWRADCDVCGNPVLRPLSPDARAAAVAARRDGCDVRNQAGLEFGSPWAVE